MNIIRTGLQPAAIRRSLVSCFAIAALSASFDGEAYAQTLSMGATNSSSSHYQIAVGMAKAIEAGMPGTTVSVVETGASVDNIRRLSRKEIDFGLVAGDVLIQGQEGSGKFNGKGVDDLVALYPYSESIINVAVRADSKIERLEDLNGKKFTPGIRGSGGEAFISQAFAILGIKPDYVFGTVTDAVEGVKNGQLVGYSKYAASDKVDSALQELMTSTKMRILSFTPEQQKAIQAKIRGVGFRTIAKGFVPDNESFNTPSVMIYYASRTSLMKDDRAFDIARSIDQHKNFLIDVWPQLKKFDFAEAMKLSGAAGITVHPGAMKYWQSAK